MYAALEVEYTEADQDPNGEAYNNAEKVRRVYIMVSRSFDRNVV